MKTPFRALSAAIVAAGIVVTAVATPASAAPPAPPSVPPSGSSATGAAATGGTSATVTLITGDVVTLNRSTIGNTATVVTADGRPSDARIIESNGDLYVYPKSVIEHVGARTLDRRLFNVSQLVADGYDDAHSAQLPLIVSYSSEASSRRTDAVPAGAARTRTLSSIDAAAVAEPRATSAQFWAGVTSGSTERSGGPSFASGIEKIWLDGKVHASLAESTKQIGAPDVWAGGDTGQGIRVAVIDTGIDAAHPDFAGKIAASASFVPGATATDGNGHGTHVASTIAGTGAASNGAERGVAPGATLDIAKVLDDTGSGNDSWVIEGMEWAARTQGADIVNMSLGSAPSDGSDPISQALDTLTAETGALFVVAAGNAGAVGTVSAPGSADAALTVGAVDSNDSLAPFSSRGPRQDGAVKPEITAPGVDILAARSQFAAQGEGYYQTISGTSMATPHVAGAAALLLQAHPDYTPTQLKDALVSTSVAIPDYTPFQVGTGRVDAAAAVAASVFASGTASVDRSAADSAGIVSQPVTYTNTGDAEVTLSLELAAPSAPAGLFALSAKSVTVPAHGTAKVTLRTTMAMSSTSSDSSGTITATVGKKVVARTAIGVGALLHKLSFTITDTNGAPGHGAVEFLDKNEFSFITIDGSGSVYLPEGTYSAMLFGEVTGVHGPSSLGSALVGDPDIDLSKDRAVSLDFSKARQIQTTVPQPTRDTYARLDYFRKIGTSETRSFDGALPSYDSLWTVPTARKVTHGEFDLTARWRKEQPAFTLSAGGHDYTDATRQLGETPLPDGTASLGLVFAGLGTPAEYAGLKATGKAVVVRRDASVSDAERAEAAIAAGAKVLIVKNDYLGISLWDYTDNFAPSPIEIIGLSQDEGDLLIAQAQKKGAKATVTSTTKAAYVYDVMQSHRNEIPKSLLRHEDKGTLARVTEDFSNTVGAPYGVGEFRYDLPVFNDWAIGFTDTRPLAKKRTDWVSVSDAYRWGQMAFVSGDTVEYSPYLQYTPGSQNEIGWFTPITRPYVNNAYRAPARTDDSMYIDIPGFGGGDHVGQAQSSYQDQSISLYQGAELVAKNVGSFVNVGGLSPSALPYRLVTTTTQTPEMGGLSTSTSTQWNFTSARPQTQDTAAPLPMTQLDYAITANAKGVVKNESTVRITPQKLAGTTGGSLGKPTVALSYDDGKTWRSATVSKGPNGSWTVTVEALLRTKFVSIRTDLADSKGNSVSQTIIRAFGVK